MSAEANDVMFGVFGAMRKAHDRIVQKMGEVLDTWNDNSTVGDVSCALLKSNRVNVFVFFFLLPDLC